LLDFENPLDLSKKRSGSTQQNPLDFPGFDFRVEWDSGEIIEIQAAKKTNRLPNKKRLDDIGWIPQDPTTGNCPRTETVPAHFF
jgi:hypothetical protein